MGSFRKDLTDNKFGRLTVIEFVELRNHFSMWRCRCECGNEKVIVGVSLTQGLTRSCGCLRKEVTKKRMTTHGLSYEPIHSTWLTMKARCEKRYSHAYDNYGGRGIEVCSEWQTFEGFYDWAISNGYKKGLTIDRINVNGNYEPGNCRWVGYKEQARNTRVNRLLTYKGKTLCVAEWSEVTGISAATISARIDKLGWDVAKALTKPVNGTSYRRQE